MKKVLLVLIMIFSLNLVGCSKKNKNSKTTTTTYTDDLKDSVIMIKIDGKEIDITWENNDSVNELKNYSKNELTISMHQYGGFEQVGAIGKNIKSNDSKITTSPGDVVLYSDNQIVIFFDSNTWSYTKLGHINLNKTELEELLKKDSVILTLSIGNKAD